MKWVIANSRQWMALSGRARQKRTCSGGMPVRSVEHQLRALLAGLDERFPAPVVLAAGEGAHLYVLAPGVHRLLSSGVRLRLVNTDAAGAIAAVTDMGADVAVAVIEDVPEGLEGTVIASYPQVAALPSSHALSRRRSVALRELGGEALVVPPPDRPLRTALERALDAAGASWSVAVEAEGWHAMLRIVALGAGLAIVNGCVPPGDGVVTRPVIDLPAVAYTAMYRPGALDDPRVAAVVDAVRAAAP